MIADDSMLDCTLVHGQGQFYLTINSTLLHLVSTYCLVQISGNYVTPFLLANFNNELLCIYIFAGVNVHKLCFRTMRRAIGRTFMVKLSPWTMKYAVIFTSKKVKKVSLSKSWSSG